MVLEQINTRNDFIYIPITSGTTSQQVISSWRATSISRSANYQNLDGYGKQTLLGHIALDMHRKRHMANISTPQKKNVRILSWGKILGQGNSRRVPHGVEKLGDIGTCRVKHDGKKSQRCGKLVTDGVKSLALPQLKKTTNSDQGASW